ncbi:MAG: tetratricopeptide repeat protein, partial [Cyanobacteriota bacterium]|nr:tetratricopeptide repeat protein [Cyanobacteriota bacterium]
MNREPNNLAAHRWYISSWQKKHESLRVGEQYRWWLEQQPDNELRRITRALSFSFREDPTLNSEDCKELKALLEPLPQDPERRAVALWRLIRALRFEACDGDSKLLLEQLWALADKSSLARKLLTRSTATIPLNKRWLSALQRSYGDNASNLGAARALWLDPRWEVAAAEREEKGGALHSEMLDAKSLDKARKHALRAAKKLSRSKHLAELACAYSVFLAADLREPATELVPRLKALDARWTQEASQQPFDQKDLSQVIRAAGKKYSTAQRLSSLAAIEAELGDDARLRSKWLKARGEALLALERVDEAIADLKTAHSLAPTNAALANQFAWQAALAGISLEEGLVAIEQAIATLRAESWPAVDASLWPGNFLDWRRSQVNKEAAYLDTRAWLLYKLERYEEAEKTQREALRLSPNRTLHL